MRIYYDDAEEYAQMITSTLESVVVANDDCDMRKIDCVSSNMPTIKHCGDRVAGEYLMTVEPVIGALVVTPLPAIHMIPQKRDPRVGLSDIRRVIKTSPKIPNSPNIAINVVPDLPAYDNLVSFMPPSFYRGQIMNGVVRQVLTCVVWSRKPDGYLKLRLPWAKMISNTVATNRDDFVTPYQAVANTVLIDGIDLPCDVVGIAPQSHVLANNSLIVTLSAGVYKNGMSGYMTIAFTTDASQLDSETIELTIGYFKKRD